MVVATFYQPRRARVPSQELLAGACVAGGQLALVVVAAQGRETLDQLAEGGFAEYFEPFTGEALGSSDQSWTAAVALDFLAAAVRSS